MGSRGMWTEAELGKVGETRDRGISERGSHWVWKVVWVGGRGRVGILELTSLTLRPETKVVCMEGVEHTVQLLEGEGVGERTRSRRTELDCVLESGNRYGGRQE